MKTLKGLFDLYIKSSVHVALAVVAFTGVTMFNFEIESRLYLLFYIFFATVTSYNFIKYSAIAKLRHFSLTRNLRIIQIFSLFCFIGLMYFALKQPLTVLIFSAVFALFTLVYALPALPDKRNLRSVSGIKIFVISFVWAGITVVLPVLTKDIIYIYPLIIEFIQRCLFVIVLTLPFDIRDLSSDQSTLGTIPQIYGIENARTIGVVLLTAVVILEALKIIVEPIDVAVLLLIVGITYYLIRKSTESQSKYFASFWVEGVPILWWVLLFVAESIH